MAPVEGRNVRSMFIKNFVVSLTNVYRYGEAGAAALIYAFQMGTSDTTHCLIEIAPCVGEAFFRFCFVPAL